MLNPQVRLLNWGLCQEKQTLMRSAHGTECANCLGSFRENALSVKLRDVVGAPESEATCDTPYSFYFGPRWRQGSRIFGFSDFFGLLFLIFLTPSALTEFPF